MKRNPPSVARTIATAVVALAPNVLMTAAHARGGQGLGHPGGTRHVGECDDARGPSRPEAPDGRSSHRFSELEEWGATPEASGRRHSGVPSRPRGDSGRPLGLPA